jgi:hypothetical protein
MAKMAQLHLRPPTLLMPSTLDCRLHVVPGHTVVLFIVRMGASRSVLSTPTVRFLDGLKAACGLLSFAELQRFEDAPLDELLPWAGNV